MGCLEAWSIHEVCLWSKLQGKLHKEGFEVSHCCSKGKCGSSNKSEQFSNLHIVSKCDSFLKEPESPGALACIVGLCLLVGSPVPKLCWNIVRSILLQIIFACEN